MTRISHVTAIAVALMHYLYLLQMHIFTVSYESCGIMYANLINLFQKLQAQDNSQSRDVKNQSRKSGLTDICLKCNLVR